MTAFLTSDRVERILCQLSKAIRSAIVGTEVQSEFIPHVLRDLVDLETRPMCLTEMAYDWCSEIYESRRNLKGWEDLLLTCLEIGFRHLDPQDQVAIPTLTHTEHHLEMVDIVFESQNGDAIADLLHSWTIGYSLHIPFDTRVEWLVCLHNLVPFTSRLRRLVIRSVELVGYEGFKGVEMERLVESLNHLQVAVADMDDEYCWTILLLDTIRSLEGTQHLSQWYWELLVELAIPWIMPFIRYKTTYNPQTTVFLTEAQEWSKLECWIATVWMSWPPEAGGITEEDLSCSTLLLFRQRPGAFQKLERWMERWSQMRNVNHIPESFQRICKQAREAAQRDTVISKTRKLLWASVTLWRSIATDIYPPLSVVLWASSGLL